MKTTVHYLHTMTIFIAILASTHFAHAQQHPGNGPMMPERDPMQEFLFPPELIMRFQDDIQLKKEQKEQIIAAVDEAQQKFTRMKWDLQAEVSTLQKILSENNVDENKAMVQLDKVLDQERQIKKTQMTLMIRTRNVLTEEQRAKLKINFNK